MPQEGTSCFIKLWRWKFWARFKRIHRHYVQSSAIVNTKKKKKKKKTKKESIFTNTQNMIIKMSATEKKS